MLALDKETFSYWVTHPDDLTLSDFAQMQESIAEYPYCQSLYTLTAKAASINQRSQAIPYVRQAAAHALSRNALRKLIENEFQWSDNLLSKLNELSAKHVPIPDDYEQESYALLKAKGGLSDGFPKLSLLSLPTLREASQPETIPTPEDPTLTETNLQNDLAQIAEPEPEVDQLLLSAADIARQNQLNLIESFIKNEPRISPVRTKLGEPLEQEDLTKRSKPTGGGLVTESMALILAKQGKVGKAREMYEKLMVKNPEKSAYFADKISELEQKQNSAAN